MMQVAAQPEARLVVAVDNDPQGDRYAGKFAAMARDVGLWSGRISPKGPGEDWNAVLRTRREGMEAGSVPVAPLCRLSEVLGSGAKAQPETVSPSWLGQAEAHGMQRPLRVSVPSLPASSEPVEKPAGPRLGSSPGMSL
ncbi:toprim domain-containing protein [Komagataeibacter kakiaceti]|nr:toprim domain-containing protein [Komagataeibacter kakiaceti]